MYFNQNNMPGGMAEILKTGNVAIYGYCTGALPKCVTDKEAGRIDVFARDESMARTLEITQRVKSYLSLTEISRLGADVCFLDNEAIRVLLAKYPNHARFVFVRVRPRLAWILGLPGLVRRLLNNTIHVKGVAQLITGTGQTWWMVLENKTFQAYQPIYLSLSEEVGVQGFLDYMRRERIRYVVPRFFDHLPELERPDGGDLDILVDDTDAEVVRTFLKANPGKIPVDVHTVSGPAPGSSNMPYYPPPLAKEILKNSIDGPAGSLIPEPMDAFLAFIYHILYHKGLYAGVPTTLQNLTVNHEPENDYRSVAEKLAINLGINIDINMESLDEFLASRGWRPKLDTLAAIQDNNEWVHRRFFSSRRVQELGMSVMIIREAAVLQEKHHEVIQALKDSGYKILREKVFDEKTKNDVQMHLRGGNWVATSSEHSSDYEPSMALVLLDTWFPAKMIVSPGIREARIRKTKLQLRKKFKDGPDSMIHATDDTDQSWEYIEWCFPGERDQILREIEEFYESRNVSKSILKIKYFIQNISHVGKERFKQGILKLTGLS